MSSDDEDIEFGFEFQGDELARYEEIRRHHLEHGSELFFGRQGGRAKRSGEAEAAVGRKTFNVPCGDRWWSRRHVSGDG